MGFKGVVGIVSCVIGLAVVYFGYGIRTEAPEKKIAAEPRRTAPEDRKRPVRAMNMALGNMVYFARDLGFAVIGAKQDAADSARIAARIEGQLQEIRELYRQEVAKNPALAGGLTLQFNIGPTGEVSQVRELSSRLNDSDFKQAVATAVGKWSFGDISADQLQISCPLLFVHEGMDITTLVQWEKSLAQGGENAMAARPSINNTSPSAATVAPSQAKGFQIKYATSLRKEPSFSSTALVSFPVGTKVNVLRRQGEWLEVRSDNKGPSGFVRREFVTAVEVARR